jgi:hypothetical protein
VARAVAALALAASAAGCSAFSPMTITTPYPASDGVNVDVGPDVHLRNVLVVAAEKGATGAVVASIVNNGPSPVTVQLAAQLGESTPFGQTRVVVPANGSVLVSPGQQNEMVVPDLPVGPGEFVEMSAATSASGTEYFQAPVVPPEGTYASLTAPPATPTPSATPSATASATPTGEPTGEPTPTPSESPTE